MPIQRPPSRMTGEPRPPLNYEPRLSVPIAPAAWRGPAGQVQRPPPPPPPPRKCGFCGRVRAWLVTKVRPR
jgi:hypothetical protein